jgi:threonine dehydratase
MTRELIDRVVLLDEASIARGIVHAYREERLVVEGAAAVGMSAVLDGVLKESRGPLVIVVSGCNIDIETHRRIIGAL